MIITISNVLESDHRRLVDGLCGGLNWQDGAKTAGRVARKVKRNLQADLTAGTGPKLQRIVSDAIQSHPIVNAAAQPNAFSKLLLSKTEVGGGYGLHIDNPYMTKDGVEFRTDLSFTLFLSPPETYEGGELAIEHAGQTLSFKPAAGDLVLYPSTSLHQVNPVTAGTRLVCAGWIESKVMRPDDRETLFDLINLKAELEARHEPTSPELLVLSKSIANLKRRFS